MRKRVWIVSVSAFAAALMLASLSWAHMVFSITFPTNIYLDRPGIYTYDVTIDPLYGNVGYVLWADDDTMPEGIYAAVVPPMWYFYDATNSITAELMIMALPKAQSGQIYFNLIQIIPIGYSDKHVINGPYVTINY